MARRLRIRHASAFAALLLVSVLSPIARTAPVTAEPAEGASATATDDQRLITAGGLHTCAVLDTGEVQCWGANDNGQVGNATTATSTVPRKVSGITTALAVSAGSTHTCALLYGGTVRCWGNNGSGQLGNGSTSPPDAPVLAPVVVENDADGDPLTPAVPLDGVTAIAVGGFHTCAIRGGGAVVCWGHDGSGQLGDGGATTTSYLPVAVKHDHDGNVFTPPIPITGVTAIAAGEYHTCAVIGASGVVKCWGANGSGQLGNGATLPGSDRTIATTVSGIPEDHGHPALHGPHKAIAISAGQAHTCALLEGTAAEGPYARCWGSNFFGQLGTGASGDGTDKSTPQKVKFDADPSALVNAQDMVGLRAITTGQFHTCGRTAGNGVVCWGQNGRGQLGDGTHDDRPFATPVPSLSSVRAVTAGGFHTCALVSTSMRCWGYNFYGQLGAYSSFSPIPVTVTALQGATRVTTGDGHACALVDVPDGTPPDPACWGNNANGELGAHLAPSPANSTIPVKVHDGEDAALVAAGNGHSCLLPDGSGVAECWGRNAQGQLGNDSSTPTDQPVTVHTLTSVTQLSTGGALVSGTEVGHSCARTSDASAWCWGENGSGQLGDQSVGDRDEPVKVRSDHDDDHLNTPDPPITAPVDLTGAVEVAAGGQHSCARTDNGRVRCWGANGSGQLGDGTKTSRTYAVTVDRDEEEPDPDESEDKHFDPLDGVFAVAAGGSHTCALRNPDATSIDEVWCWGDNSAGQLGDGTNSQSDVPVQVDLGPGITPLEITAGDSHTCARVKNTATNNTFALCWGADGSGQLGDASSGNSSTPVTPAGLAEIDDDDPITGVDLVTSISAGRWNTCATLIDTTVSCWGLNQYGQLGDGIGSYVASPQPVQNLSSVGGNHIPAPVDDTATILVPPPPAVATTIDVLGDDTDADATDALTIASVTDPPRGTVVNNGTDLSYTPDANFCAADPTSKTDTFSYSATDGTATVPATVTVTVECPNTAPDANDDSATTAEESAVSIAVVTNDTDVNGDTVTVDSVTPASHGTAVINPGNTSITYTPAADYFGTDTFTYKAKDPLGAQSAPAAVTVTVSNVNDPPVAADDNGTTNEDTAVVIEVVANDTDIDSPSLAVASVGGPAHGQAVATAPTKITYTPAPGFCGSDGFTYAVSDGSATDNATVTVTVNCVNDGPNAVDDSAITQEDVAVTVHVLANDTDPEGDTLTVVAVADPAHGTAVIDGGGTSVTYAPDPDFCGADDFGYTVSDGTDTDSAVVVPVVVTCQNDAPIANDDTASAPEDAVTGIAVLLNDTDVDGNTLSVTSVTTPGHGTATIGSSNVISYAPNANYCGPDTFGYTVSDGYGGTDAATVTITVTCVNDAPVVDPLPNVTTPWGETVSVALGATDADAGDTDPATSDTVAFSLVDGPAGAAVVEGPAGTFTFTWTPASGQIGSFSVTVRGTDGTGSSDDESFSMTVTKRATSLVYTGATSGQYSDPAALSAQLVDFEGTPLGGQAVAFTIGSSSVAGITNGAGTANAAIYLDGPVGTSSVLANFAGGALYAGSSSTMPFTTLKETVTVTFAGKQLTTVASSVSSTAVQLSAKVVEEADGALGSSLASAQVTFSQVGGGTLCSSPVSLDGAGGAGTATCTTSSLSLGTRGVIVKLTAAKYAGLVDVAAFTVAQAPSGSASGGGRAGSGSTFDAFAFRSVPAAKKGQPPGGDAVHVRRESGYAYVNQAGTLSSLSTSCSGGKTKTCTAVVEAPSSSRWKVNLSDGTVTALSGTSTLRIDAVDVIEPDGAGADRYSVTLGPPDSYGLGTATAPVVITAGNVRVVA